MGFISFVHGLRKARSNSAVTFDEDTAVSEAIIGCGEVISRAAKEVSDFCRTVPKGWPDEVGSGSVDVERGTEIMNLAIDAERCGAYLKGIRNALGADVSREYLMHLVNVANAIGRARKGGFAFEFACTIPACIEPDDIRHFGGVKSDEEMLANGVDPTPEACKDGTIVVDVPKTQALVLVEEALAKAKVEKE